MARTLAAPALLSPRLALRHLRACLEFPTTLCEALKKNFCLHHLPAELQQNILLALLGPLDAWTSSSNGLRLQRATVTFAMRAG